MSRRRVIAGTLARSRHWLASLGAALLVACNSGGGSTGTAADTTAGPPATTGGDDFGGECIYSGVLCNEAIDCCATAPPGSGCPNTFPLNFTCEKVGEEHVCVHTLNGGNGHDVVVGGIGGDWLAGGLGDETLLGGEGNDSMVGDPGDDVLHGGPGDDSLYGKDDDDELWGGTGDDLIQEGTYTGADVALPGAGIDEVHAGAGDDQIVVLDLCEVGSGEVLDGGSGNDTLWLPAGVVSGDLTALGVTLQSIETVSTIVGAPWGGSECAA